MAGAIKLEDLNPRVTLNLGVTLPTGNYKSARADVGLTVDRPGNMTVNETFEWLETMLLTRLDKVIADVTERAT